MSYLHLNELGKQPGNGKNVYITLVVTQQNLAEIPAFIELGNRDVKMMYVVEYVPSPFGRGAIHLPGRHEDHYRLNVSTIFRDGHQLEIQNYAIIGQTLWVLDERNSTKIALSDLDLSATDRENRARGLRFSLPSAK